MSVNRRRGEISAELDGRPHRLCLTLGALAELEATYAADDLAALVDRFSTGRLSALDMMRVIGAGLRGAGEDVADDEVGAMRCDAGAAGFAIGRRRQTARLRPFLQPGLGVAGRLERLDHAVLPELGDQRLGCRITAIDEHGADQALAGVRENGGAQPSAGMGFRIAEPQFGAEVHVFRDRGAGFLAHQIGQPLRQFAFVGLGEVAIQHVGNDETEHVVAEKLEPLIARDPVLRPARQRRDMGERPLEQRLVGKAVANPRFEPRAVFDLAAHRTIENSLFQRTETGQRQNCQACSPSLTEKKMICALPTKFSNGTKPTDEKRLSVELSRLSPIMK